MDEDNDEPAPKVYEQAHDLQAVRAMSQQYMLKFNEAFKLLKMELVFFHDALEHVRLSYHRAARFAGSVACF